MDKNIPETSSSSTVQDDNTFKKPKSVDRSSELKQFSILNFVKKTPVQPAPKKQKAQCKTRFPYLPPPWSGKPDKEYKLQELKNGEVVQSLVISQKSFWILGKEGTCDIKLANPTISRFHAALVFRDKSDKDLAKGYYIYDFGSTHGTYVNKFLIKPKEYVNVKVGHMIKFGRSTRLYFLKGPPEDQEPETEMTWTELKKKQNDKLIAKKTSEVAQNSSASQETEDKDFEEDGIDWGMGEDADSDSDLSDNPFATQNEELYIKDPKKTLEGWFEREGLDLEFKVENKGFAHHICRVELPIGTAQAIVKGKKKAAIVQCALEACRILDRYGFLRQANQESRKKRLQKDWEAMDYYDSDEDNFLDRTGDIEKKRRKRMISSGRKDMKPETRDHLEKMLEDLTKKVEKSKNKLLAILKPVKNVDVNSDTDTLDDYMININETTISEENIKDVQNKLLKMQAVTLKILKKANVAKPARMPSIPLKYSDEEEEEENGQGTDLQSKAVDLEHNAEATISSKEEWIKKDKLETDNTNIQEMPVAGSSKMQETALKRSEDQEAEIKKQKVIKEDDLDAKDVSNWTPPPGQTGDGRTHLNDKFGY